MLVPSLSGSLTVADWSIRWLEECPRGEGTTRAYRYAMKLLVDRFGGRQIRTISEAEGNSFMVSSPKNAGDVARVMFSDARRLGLIPRNPFAGHRRSLPSLRRPTLPVCDELERLLRASVNVHGPVYGDHFAAMIEVAAWSAVRPGELFALCMQQVDLERNTINVDRQLLRSGCLGPPKTRRDSDFSSDKYPNIKAHTLAAIAKGWPRILVLNRPGGAQRRDRLLEQSGLAPRTDEDRDEYPPAVGRGRSNGSQKGLVRGINPLGWMADVMYVPDRENQSHGSSLGAKLRGLCNGTRFRYVFG
jgi:hypothetical protein